MTNDTIIVAASIFGGIYAVATLAYFAFRQYLRAREKERALEHVRLDDFRAHLERQLMDMNARFASSEARWNELNHLVVGGQNRRKEEWPSKDAINPSEFLRSHGIDGNKLKVRHDMIFVLTPFHDDLMDEFMTVTMVGQELGFSVYRGDERAARGDIFPQLLEMIVSARVVIANITGRNPNVFYELGLAHALDKPVILLSKNPDEVPFDLRSKRIVFYSSNEDLKRSLAVVLGRTLAAIGTPQKE